MKLLRTLFARFLIWSSGTYVGAPEDGDREEDNREGATVAPGER